MGYVPLKFERCVMRCLLRWYSLLTVIVLLQIKHICFGRTLLNIYFTVRPLSNSRISLPAVTDVGLRTEQAGRRGGTKLITRFPIGRNELANLLALEKLFFQGKLIAIVHLSYLRAGSK